MSRTLVNPFAAWRELNLEGFPQKYDGSNRSRPAVKLPLIKSNPGVWQKMYRILSPSFCESFQVNRSHLMDSGWPQNRPTIKTIALVSRAWKRYLPASFKGPTAHLSARSLVARKIVLCFSLGSSE
jgi:hypothetical protein